MELYDKFLSNRKKYPSKGFNNKANNSKNFNFLSFKKIKPLIPNLKNPKTARKTNVNNYIPKYNINNLRNNKKYTKPNSKSYNNISLNQQNYIKINLNNKIIKFKSKSQSKNKKFNNISLFLSERLKNKTSNILLDFNSNNKESFKNNKYIDKNENDNLISDFNQFDSNRTILSNSSSKTTRKNMNKNNFDLVKNFEYFKVLENKIKEIQKRIKNTKKSLYINEIHININNNKKNEVKNFIPKIEDLLLNKNNITKDIKIKDPLIHKNKNNSKIRKEKKIDFYDEDLNKKESKKAKSNNNLYTILNYNSETNIKTSDNSKNISKKKNALLSSFFSNYKNRHKNIYIANNNIIIPIKAKRKKRKNRTKNKTDYLSKNDSIKEDSDSNINYIYYNYMSMTPHNNKKQIKVNLHNTAISKTNRAKKIISEKKAPKLFMANSCKNLNSLSSSKIIKNRNKNNIICIRNNKKNNSTNISLISSNKNMIQSEIINKKIIKNASICRKGKNRKNEIQRKFNQDNLFKIKYEDLNLFLYGVCDGHGFYGHLVSEYIKNNLPIILYNNLCLNMEKDTNINVNNGLLYKSIKDSFLQTENKLINNSKINLDFSGSTCIAILFNNNEIIVANVGDSRAIKGQYISKKEKWTFEILNNEHKPENKEEYIRIKKCHGLIHPFVNEKNEFIGPQRVWIKNNKNIPGLAMSRSFGDKIFTSVGVISTPDILFFKHKSNDKFIVIASDGLWMYVSNQEVVEIVGKYYETLNCDKAIEELYLLAKSRFEEYEDYIDDISIIILFFG